MEVSKEPIQHTTGPVWIPMIDACKKSKNDTRRDHVVEVTNNVISIMQV